MWNNNSTVKVLNELETQRLSTVGIMNWDGYSTTVSRKVSIGLSDRPPAHCQGPVHMSALGTAICTISVHGMCLVNSLNGGLCGATNYKNNRVWGRGAGGNVAKKYHNTCLYSKISKIKPNILCLHIERLIPWQTTNHPTVHIIFADDLKQILKIQLNVLCLHTETLIPWQQQFNPLSIIFTNHLTHVFILKYQILSSFKHWFHDNYNSAHGIAFWQLPHIKF